MNDGPAEQRRRFSCDTLIAFEGEGRDRRAIFGKNSDRPLAEAQPLTCTSARAHVGGSTVRCQWLTIPEAEKTLAVVGSRPWWMWGFEQGLNSAGVAIGNEAIYTRDEVPSIGLQGMDLVRLGLERGETARAAKRVITDHVERYGQGGSSTYLGSADATELRYQNSFIIGDANEGFVVETSGRRWVSKRVVSGAAIANLVTITDDWDEASPDIEEHARQRGWWNEPPGVKLDFRRAYEDPEMRAVTETRYAQSCRFLDLGQVTLQAMMRHLRDHYDGGTVYVRAAAVEKPRPLSICLHPEDREGATAASMVVDLTAARRQPIAWCSMATPCSGVFIPVPVGEPVPSAWTIGGEQHDERSLWWSMRALAEAIRRDYVSLTPLVQSEWFAWETELVRETYADPDSSAQKLEERTARLLARRGALLDQIDAHKPARSGSGVTA
jgi:secernin